MSTEMTVVGESPGGAILLYILNSANVILFHYKTIDLNIRIVSIVSMAQMMIKRIPVSEARWKQLGQMKEAGQTYDELLGELLQAHNRRELAAFAKAAHKGEGNWHKLEDI